MATKDSDTHYIQDIRSGKLLLGIVGSSDPVFTMSIDEARPYLTAQSAQVDCDELNERGGRFEVVSSMDLVGA